MENDNTMLNIMNLAKLFAPPTSSNTKTTPDGKSWPMFPIDAEIHTEPLRICKSLIPYLPFEKQKSLSIFIKVYELISVVNHFSAIGEQDQPSTNFRQSDTWQMDLLHSVKDSLDPANAYWVDILFKVNDVKNILASVQSGGPYQESNATPASSNPIQPDFSPIQPYSSQLTSQPTNQSSNQPSNEFIQNISPMLDDNQRKLLETLSTIMK